MEYGYKLLIADNSGAGDFHRFWYRPYTNNSSLCWSPRMELVG